MTVQDCIQYVQNHLEVRYATKNGAYTSGRTITPQGAVNHSVGCAQPNPDVFFNSMNKSSAGWGVNAILGDFHIGEGRIILTLRENSRPWGCGAGKYGSWNNTRVQWEVCEPSGHTYAGGTMIGYDVAKNQVYFDRMWKMLVCWNVYMAVKFGYPVSAINDHYEAGQAGYGSAHADMHQWLPKHGKSMDALRDEVQAILNGEDDEDMTQEKFNEMMDNYLARVRQEPGSEWSEVARDWAVKNGLISGGGTLPDGSPNYMWRAGMTREEFSQVLWRAVQNGVL